MVDLYEELSEERKKLQEQGELPEWFQTAGWQLFKSKYLYNSTGLKGTYSRIARTASKHTDNPDYWYAKFFDVMWRGWLACSTPVLSNMGTDRGMPVSCSGGYVEDSIDGFYSSYHETAVLTKNGFGTSSYLGDIRPRGSPISGGGRASGVLPIIQHFVHDMRSVSQGNSRRGAWAGYLPIDHPDWPEVVDYLEHHPDDLNLGWVVSASFIDRLNNGDPDALQRYQRSLKVKAVTGKGYYFFKDKVNNLSPQMYKDLGLDIKASNLCTEITLHSDSEHTFTCVLSSMNLAKFDEWKNTDAIRTATVFLDCVASEFIERAKNNPKLSNAVAFTEKSRALGLGTLGFHTYLQQHGVSFESFEAHMINIDIFSRMKEGSLIASKWMAKVWGEPEWCKGYGVRNTHRLAVAPNTSSALICGGVSQGIEPIVANVYNQTTSAGEMHRINPTLLNLGQKRGVWNKYTMNQIIEDNGSVSKLPWLSDDEKKVFKTAYEVDQRAIIRLAATRQAYIDQAQSINLFFDADEDEKYISEIHREAFMNPNIKSLYYMRTMAGVQASKDSCEACEG